MPVYVALNARPCSGTRSEDHVALTHTSHRLREIIQFACQAWTVTGPAFMLMGSLKQMALLFPMLTSVVLEDCAALADEDLVALQACVRVSRAMLGMGSFAVE